MGRTVKISEVKLFDVFVKVGDIFRVKWVKLTNGVCIINLGHVVQSTADHEVEVIGRMEFICDGPKLDTDKLPECCDDANWDNQEHIRRIEKFRDLQFQNKRF